MTFVFLLALVVLHKIYCFHFSLCRCKSSGSKLPSFDYNQLGWIGKGHSIPHICQFWYTTAIFRPLKSTSKTPQFHARKPKICHIGQNFTLTMLKSTLDFKSTPPPVLAVLTCNGSILILQHLIFVLLVTTIIFVPPASPPPYHREVVITLPAGQIGQIAGLPLCTRKPYLLQIWPAAVKQDKALASATKM